MTKKQTAASHPARWRFVFFCRFSAVAGVRATTVRNVGLPFIAPGFVIRQWADDKLFAVVGVRADNKRQRERPNKRTQSSLGITRVPNHRDCRRGRTTTAREVESVATFALCLPFPKKSPDTPPASRSQG